MYHNRKSAGWVRLLPLLVEGLKLKQKEEIMGYSYPFNRYAAQIVPCCKMPHAAASAAACTTTTTATATAAAAAATTTTATTTWSWNWSWNLFIRVTCAIALYK